MIDRFLKAKHWQLFIVTFGITMIFQFVIMGSMILNLDNQVHLYPGIIFNRFKFIPLIILLFMGLTFVWFWSVGIGLQKRVPENVTMKVKKFKVFLFIPMIYMFILGVLLSFASNGLFEFGSKPNWGLIGGLFTVIVLLHLFSVFCIFYSLYFVAKTIKTAELQRAVEFGDFVGEFFLIWFYPIGIWIIQPRVNKMIE